MNVLALSRDEFNATVRELEAQGMDTAGLKRQYREASSPFSPLYEAANRNRAELAEEGRRPVLGGLFSKEPVVGVDTIRYEGFGPMMAGLLEPVARAVDAPYSAAQGLIPAEDMIGEAMGTAGVAMGAGGAVARPANSVGMGGRVKAASDVADRGDTILDMLKSGRGSDVTDDMLDMGDSVKNTQLNQYLFENYDLPMDEASRMARAREMGFDTDKVRYHGSGLDLSRLDPNMGTGERYRTGVFSTDNPDVADSYVSTSDGTIYPVITRRNDGGSSVDASGANWNKIPPSAPARIAGSALEQEFPELFGDVSTTAYDVAPSLYDDLFNSGASTNALARQKRFEGDSNITFQNLVDRGPAIKRYLGEDKEMQRARELSASQPSEVRVDFYGNQIRSPSARFDPRLSHLSNLTAANASTPAGLLAMQADDEQDIRAYLRSRGLLNGL